LATIVIIFIPVLAGLVLWWSERRRLSKPSDIGPTCERCGYLLIGLMEPRCPECGEPFPRADIRSLLDELDQR